MLPIDCRPPASNTPISSSRGDLGVGSSGLTGATTRLPQIGSSVSELVTVVGVVPQVTCPPTLSPTATGPNRYMWKALTVREPSGLTICSLNTTLNTSPTLVITP